MHTSTTALPPIPIEDELQSPVPPQSGTAGSTSYDFFQKNCSLLDHRELSLSAVIVPLRQHPDFITMLSYDPVDVFQTACPSNDSLLDCYATSILAKTGSPPQESLPPRAMRGEEFLQHGSVLRFPQINRVELWGDEVLRL
jgi:hypothetical protein